MPGGNQFKRVLLGLERFPNCQDGPLAERLNTFHISLERVWISGKGAKRIADFEPEAIEEIERQEKLKDRRRTPARYLSYDSSPEFRIIDFVIESDTIEEAFLKRLRQ